MKRTVWIENKQRAPALFQVAEVLEDDAFCLTLREAVRLGRAGTLEEYDVNTPRFQRGQAAYLKVCNQLRKALGRTKWEEEHPENQQCFVLPGSEHNFPIRLTYFAGRFDEEKSYFKINPKGKLTKLSLAKNREQMTFLDESGFWTEHPVSSESPEITLFLMSTWEWNKVEDTWRVKFRTWIALCDTALDRRGKPQDDEDYSRFTRATIVAYRELDDFTYGGPAVIPEGPQPIKISPVVFELSEIEEENGGH